MQHAIISPSLFQKSVSREINIQTLSDEHLSHFQEESKILDSAESSFDHEAQVVILNPNIYTLYEEEEEGDEQEEEKIVEEKEQIINEKGHDEE